VLRVKCNGKAKHYNLDKRIQDLVPTWDRHGTNLPRDFTCDFTRDLRGEERVNVKWAIGNVQLATNKQKVHQKIRHGVLVGQVICLTNL
jgi:hypothetical protein